MVLENILQLDQCKTGSILIGNPIFQMNLIQKGVKQHKLVLETSEKSNRPFPIILKARVVAIT